MIERWLPSLLLLACAQTAFAHKASDSYLTLKVESGTIDGRWDIALRDLDYAIGLDTDGNSEITWGELRAKRGELETYAFSHLVIDDSSTPCKILPSDYLVDTHTDGAYSVLRFKATCRTEPQTLGIDYSLFFDLDPQHRGLLRVDYLEASHTAVLSPTHPRQLLELAQAKLGITLVQYWLEGIWHIWIGYDHVLFLLSVLLPAVLIRSRQQWQPVERFRPTLIEVVKIVTAFTVAHSITLALAAFEVVSLPSRWIESAIAASVILAALNNVYPLIHRHLWLVAFAFGLVHGFGFANVLKDLGLAQNMLILALLAFNIGVETGQLTIVCGFMPLAYWLRKTVWYRIWILCFGSIVIAFIALIWLLERLFDLKLLGF